MTEFIDAHPEAPAALLVLGLLWVVLAFAAKVARMGDDTVSSRLDALAVPEIGSVPPADRYARFEQRDYSGDRGPAPDEVSSVLRFGNMVVPRWTDFYAELCDRLGDPFPDRRAEA